eukprot:946072_1
MDTKLKESVSEPTVFQRKVYALCKSIPSGSVTTYGAIAGALHSHPRAVGQALKRNPFAPVVPCHRVIRADLTVGGFQGSLDQDSPNVCRKIELLKSEGIHFGTDGKLVKSQRPSVILKLHSNPSEMIFLWKRSERLDN